MLKWVLIALLLVMLATGVVIVIKIGPANVIGMLRYDQREEGTLRVGDRAPDVELLAPDGATPVRLSERLQGRPHVIVFGSFT
jgi:hypothetical protein